MPLEGLQLGHYRLVHLIGSGGMGEVYLAEDSRIRRQVAIKIIRAEATPYPDANATREAARLFQREMRAITTLDHPHILPLYDFGEETVNKATLTYMVMPYRTEGSLADWLQERGSAEMLSPQDVAHFIQQAADALQHAHDHQLIHQDIKPSNFLIRNRAANPSHPDLLLADFGIAKFTTATATTSQSIRGTPAFMAPEQWDGHPVAATDQYALAVMAYQLLAGHPPFQGGPGHVMRQHFMTQPQPPSTLNPHIPPALDMVILRALEKQPADRFSSIMAFAQAFQEALQGTNASSIAKGQSLPGGADIRATLAISEAEALAGTNRTLTLPGRRRVTIAVPPGTYDGQVVYLAGQGEPSRGGGPTGSLILTISIQRAEEANSASNVGSAEKTARASNPNLQRPPVHKSDPYLQSPRAFTANTSPRDQGISALNAMSARSSTSRRSLSTGRKTLLIGLAFLVIVGGLGAFFLVRNQNPYPSYSGTPALNDPLSDNSKGYNWSEGTNDQGSCSFSGGSYHVGPSAFFSVCIAQNTHFSNFNYEVQMEIISGDCGGIIFRADVPNYHYYFFRICQDGSYSLQGTNPDNYQGTSPNIHTGLNQLNLIAVVANGSHIDLYVNNQHINGLSDSTFSQGQIGVFSDSFTVSDPTEVAFSNAKVWTL